MVSVKQIEKWIGSRQMSKVESIEIDYECIEVVLINGFINDEYNETIWAWGLHHFECGSTLEDCRSDLMNWFNNVQAED